MQAAAANVNALRDFLTDRPDTWNMNPVMNGEGKLTPILHTGLFVHPVLNAKPPLDGVHTFTSLFFKHLCAFCPSKPLLDMQPRFQTFMGAFIPNIYAFDPFVLCRTIQPK